MNLFLFLKKLRTYLLLIAAFNFLQVFGQQTISGQVTTEGGEGLPGATIMIKGTNNGTVTGANGEYSISADASDILIITFLGFETAEIPVGNRSKIEVQLKEELEFLEAVVVLGYTEKSQKELSASVVSIGSEDLQSVTSANIETMLQGQAAGVTVSSSTGAPGAAADIRIRGITSINSDRPPLFVVDGIIGGNYVPNDVENITILKDAAAIGLYGAAGAAGVIIVTTKRGSGQPYLNVSASYGVKEATMGNFEMMNGSELYDAQFRMWGADEGGDNLISFLNNRPEDLQETNFDWFDAAFGQAAIQNYNISMGGSGGSSSYGFSIDYFDEEGTFINTDFERVNLKAFIKFNPIEKLTISSDVNVQVNTNNFEHYSWFEDAFWNMPWDNPYANDGSLLTPEYVTDPSNDWYGQFRRSFLYSTDLDELKFSGTDLVWSGLVTYDLTDWMSLESRNRFGTYNSKTNVYHSPLTDFGLANNGVIDVNQENGFSIASTNFIRLYKSFGDHDLSGFLAYEVGRSQSETLNFSGQNLSSTSIQVPSGASVLIQPLDGPGSLLKTKGESYISEVSYSYAGKYFATAYFRRDGSSLFAANKEYGNFYGGSFGWLLSEEDFLKDLSFVELLKFRLSYGTTGNSNIDPFLSLPTYDITRQYNDQPGGEPNNPSNPNLGWESTSMTNLGLDLSLTNGLDVTIDLYQKSVSGMLLRNPLPFSSGYESRIENIGDMQNKGIELMLKYDRQFGDFRYSGNFNVSYNKNEITKVTDILDEQAITAGAIQQINVVGEEAFMWYMPKWLGVDPATGGPTWETVTYDDNGNVASRGVTTVYEDATFQPIESSLPEVTGGFRNSISYKSFTLDFLFSFQMGNHIYHYTRFFVDSDGANTGVNLMRLQDDWSRWENPGDIATHPELNRGGNNSAHQNSSRYIEKGDFLRLRNITLSYVLPQSIIESVGMKRGSVNFRIDNLKTWTDFSGMDPDIGLSVSAFSLPGLSYLKYPISKQFVLGVNLNF